MLSPDSWFGVCDGCAPTPAHAEARLASKNSEATKAGALPPESGAESVTAIDHQVDLAARLHFFLGLGILVNDEISRTLR